MAKGPDARSAPRGGWAARSVLNLFNLQTDSTRPYGDENRWATTQAVPPGKATSIGKRGMRAAAGAIGMGVAFGPGHL
jgi:hypothetical protein